ncbi:MAG: penicillin-binding protein 1C, partial [Desulfoferrobacter sp.]
YSGLRATPSCPVMQEWFVPETIPEQYCNLRESHKQSATEIELVQTPVQTVALLQPTPNLQLAMDPHIPDEMEAFAFMIPKHLKPQKVEWIVDDEIAGVTAAKENQFLWPLSPGTHCARARIWRPGDVTPQETPQVNFQVK